MTSKFSDKAVHDAIAAIAKCGCHIPHNAMHAGLSAAAEAMKKNADQATTSIAEPNLDEKSILPDQPNFNLPWDLRELAHQILGAFCSCYGEAYPAKTCSNEQEALATRLQEWLAPAGDWSQIHSALIAAQAWIADGGHDESGSEILNQISSALATVQPQPNPVAELTSSNFRIYTICGDRMYSADEVDAAITAAKHVKVAVFSPESLSARKD